MAIALTQRLKNGSALGSAALLDGVDALKLSEDKLDEEKE
jgi:hypothetical protein